MISLALWAITPTPSGPTAVASESSTGRSASRLRPPVPSPR